MSDTQTSSATGSLIQPISSGLLAAVVGFASSFAVVLAGYTAAGATPAQAASGLFAICLGQGILGVVFATWTRMPITIAWSTPGAALLIATGTPAGGYPVAVGCYLVAAALIIVAGIWRPFGRAVASIPLSIAGAMLAGVLLELCLAPVHAVVAAPALALPIVAAWAIALRFTRAYAIPIAVVVTALVVAATTTLPPASAETLLPHPVFVMPSLTLTALVGIAVPLFIVTMATQNVPGLAVLTVNGYRPPVGPIFVWTGIGSIGTALIGGHSLNLAAITAAICAGPDAHPNPARRWIASVACGLAYIAVAFGATFATAFVTASPPLLVEAVAGLALLGALGAALSSAVSKEDERVPALVTFVTAASGVSFLGIGAAFWGLIAGLALLGLLKWRPA
ncbi:MAG TPA: benzoate/H(+) symporter BenE family transporter [Bauldia sp.]|nr:benzoate/H(+) symporter BenE family transporter [Bauldia sp.]